VGVFFSEHSVVSVYYYTVQANGDMERNINIPERYRRSSYALTCLLLDWAVDPTDLSTFSAISYGWTVQSWIDKSGHRRHTARHLGWFDDASALRL